MVFFGRKVEWLSDELPIDVDEIGYELYPKNGDQMWESYKKYSKECKVKYDDNIVLDSISRTYSIAHNRIQTFLPDNTVRLPDFVVPEGKLRGKRLQYFVLPVRKKKVLPTNQITLKG